MPQKKLVMSQQHYGYGNSLSFYFNISTPFHFMWFITNKLQTAICIDLCIFQILLLVIWMYLNYKFEICKQNRYMLAYWHGIIFSGCFFFSFIMFIYKCAFNFTVLLFIVSSNDIVGWKFISKRAEFPIKEHAFPASILPSPEFSIV